MLWDLQFLLGQGGPWARTGFLQEDSAGQLLWGERFCFLNTQTQQQHYKRSQACQPLGTQHMLPTDSRGRCANTTQSPGVTPWLFSFKIKEVKSRGVTNHWKSPGGKLEILDDAGYSVFTWLW